MQSMLMLVREKSLVASIASMAISAIDYDVLINGPLYRFADWPNASVPVFGAGVYTIWHSDGRFIYVGMSGRGMTTDTKRRNTPQGLYTRLESHSRGRRSGDQFCVYVADRLVLPTLSPDHCVGTALDGCISEAVHP